MRWFCCSLFVLLTAGQSRGQDVSGLLVEASDGARTVRFAAATPHFRLDPAESIHPALSPRFRAEFRGLLTVLQAGDYEFDIDVQINGKAGRRFALTSGKHSFVVSYARTPEAVASLRLRWRSAAFEWEPLPAGAFTRPAMEFPAETGRTLVENLGCAQCHGGGTVKSKLEGGRSAAWLNSWLAKPQARMPHLLNEKQRADVVAYVAGLLTPPNPPGRKPNEVDIGKGGELFGTLGCASCHALSGLGSKYSYAALYARVAHHEPSMLLKPEEVTALAGFLMRSEDTSLPPAPQGGDAAAGRTAVAGSGCLACHTVAGLENQQRGAKPLASLLSADCRAAKYSLDAAQKSAIAAYLALGADRSPAPVYQLPRRLAALRCTACHQAGAEAPSLVGAGEKLKSAWLEKVLWGKERVRPGREIRMPHYDRTAVADLVPAFAKAEGLEPGDGPSPPVFAAERRTAGHGMLGTNPKTRGMACIGCHDWGEFKSLGEEGPQLINTTERMRWDWFYRWMRNPARILSGTSMPSYFAAMPQPRAAELIGNLWAGMSLGKSGPVPDGYKVADLGRDRESKPVVEKEAVIVRWDMPEATPAAIAVGLPGGVSYCFDAGQSRVLYAWRGGFVDMSGTLLRKTDKNKLTPSADLVGEIFWKSSGPPIRVGDRNQEPVLQRFRGYRLTANGIPEFRYEVDGVEVRERLEAIPNSSAIRRELVFTEVNRPVWFEGKEVPRGKNVKVEARIGQ